MAAGSVLTQIQPGGLYRETSVGYDAPFNSAVYSTSSGSSRGIRFQKLISSQLLEYYSGIYYVPALIALGTGLTCKFAVTDNGADANDLGKVVRLEVTPYNLSTASAPIDYSLTASKGTATAANVTLSTTSGVLATCTIAIVTANLASLAAGNWFGIRLRRVGDNAADTCLNDVLCTGGVVYDT